MQERTNLNCQCKWEFIFWNMIALRHGFGFLFFYCTTCLCVSVRLYIDRNCWFFCHAVAIQSSLETWTIWPSAMFSCYLVFFRKLDHLIFRHSFWRHINQEQSFYLRMASVWEGNCCRRSYKKLWFSLYPSPLHKHLWQVHIISLFELVLFTVGLWSFEE